MSLMKPKLPVGGLALGPNDLDSPPGNFQVAENVVHRREGILEPMPGDQEVGEGWVLPETVARIFSDWPMDYSLRITKNPSTSSGRLSYGDAVPTEYTEASFGAGRTQCVYADGRHILSGAQFNVVLDGDTDSTHGDPRRAGLPPVSYIGLTQQVDTTGTDIQSAIPANKTVAYTAVIRRRLGDRFIVSAPSAKVHTEIVAYPSRCEISVRCDDIAIDGGSTLFSATDEVLLFRTKAADSVAELNDTYYLAGTANLQISGDYAHTTVVDNTLENALGAELYVNPGQEGSLKTNLIPPASSGVETFGLTTFYINKRAQPALTATTAGAFGLLPAGGGGDLTSQQRKNGIGTRQFTGTKTNGSEFVLVPDVDAVGLAIGQLVFADFTGYRTIVGITGAGPVTIELDSPLFSGSGPVSMEAYDAIRIEATTNTGSVTSEWIDVASFQVLQTNLLELEEAGTGDRMHGFVVRSSTPTGLDPASLNVDGVSLLFSVLQPDQWFSFRITATNPQNWVEGVVSGDYRVFESVQDTNPNVVWYGKPNQPEHVAPVQFIRVGNGTVYRLLNVQSCMLAFCSDGIYKIDGQGDQWFITLVDNAARLVHPDCAVANTTTAFAWLESGLALCTETGTQNISKDAIGPDLQPFVKFLYARTDGPQYVWGPQMAIDRLNSDVYLLAAYIPNEDDPVFLKCYVFNTLTAKFTTCGEEYTAMCYAPSELCVLRSKDGFLYVDSSIETDYKIATVVYLPLVDDAGIVKQWNDVNYFFDNAPTGSAPGTYDVEALFGGELTSTTNVFEKDQTGAPTNMFALHCLVPRRAARGVELILGFRTSTEVSEIHPSGGYYFQFKGVSVRARVSSQVIKR